MGVSTIDGTLEEAVLKRVRRNLRVYERLTFRLADGSTRSIAKSIVDAPVAERLLPGTSGRFYLYTAIDHRGLHGLRDATGQAVFSYPTNNEKALLVVMPILLLWIVVALVLQGGIPILGALVLLVSIPFYFLYRATRMEARRQFEADSAFAAPSPPPAAAAPAGGA
jgi:hypothetical protein